MIVLENKTYVLTDDETEKKISSPLIPMDSESNQVVYHGDKTIRAWIIDNEGPIAEKIKSSTAWDFILDDTGNLVDIDLKSTEFTAIEEEPKPSIEQLQADILYLSMMTGIDLN